MQDLDLADPELVLIINITENKVCNDCQKKNPRWCSINNAVLLCASCARKHRKFNEYISKIKSLEGDLWTKDEIKRLYIGGNERFNQMLKSYNIPLTNDNVEYKYHTKIAGYYRDLLSEELKGKKVIDLVKPSLKEGIELLSKEEYDKLNQYIPSQDNILQNDNNNNINNNSDVLNIPKSTVFANPFALHINLNNNNDNNDSNNFNNRNNNNNFNNNIREDTFEQHLNDFADTMGTVFNNISQKAQSIDYNEKLKNAGDYIMDKKEKIENSETFKGFMSALSTGIDSLVRKTEDFFNDSLDNNLYHVNNEQRGNVNRFNNRNQNQFNFQGQRINNRNNNNINNNNNNFNNNNLNKNVSNYRPINNNMNNNIPLNNMNNNNNNISQNNMNNNVPLSNMNNNNVVQNQSNINSNGNNNNSNDNNFNNVNINIEDLETPDGEDDIPKIIYNNSPQNMNNQGEQNNNSNGNNNSNNVVNLDGSNNEKNNNDNNIESLDGNNNEKNNNI